MVINYQKINTYFINTTATERVSNFLEHEPSSPGKCYKIKHPHLLFQELPTTLMFHQTPTIRAPVKSQAVYSQKITEMM